jgi:predicted alpha/beta hydrolase family esterase
MAKRAFIIHGWDGAPDHGWYPWLKKKLEDKGFEVHVPAMPDPDEPKIGPWVSALKKEVGKVDKDTFFVGHSVGCQTIMRFFENLDDDTKVGGVIFVAPWMHLDAKTIEEEGEEVKEIARPWVETPIDYDKIRKFAKYVCLFSDNDPYVPLSDIDLFEEKLGADTILEYGKGHFMQDDGCNELPFVFDEIMKLV